jgi:hypothetical protein
MVFKLQRYYIYNYKSNFLSKIFIEADSSTLVGVTAIHKATSAYPYVVSAVVNALPLSG